MIKVVRFQCADFISLNENNNISNEHGKKLEQKKKERTKKRSVFIIIRIITFQKIKGNKQVFEIVFNYLF